MEKNTSSEHICNHALKSLLTVGALFLTLSLNSPKIFAQKTETQQELAPIIDSEPEELQTERERNFFINNFAHIINNVKDEKDLPYSPRYKNPAIAQKHKFPATVDIEPKNIDPKTKKDSIPDVCVVLGDRKFKIVPFVGIKVLHREFKENKGLDDPKMILILSNKFGPNTIKMSCKEFAKYAYEFTQIPKGGKKIFRSSLFSVHEVSAEDKSPKSNKPLLTQNIAEKSAL